MRIECAQCRTLVEPTWTVAGAEVHATCPSCGAVSSARLSATSATTAAAAAGVEPGGRECPKCGHRPVDGEACGRCGLAVARMAAWVEAQTASPALADAWAACVAAWDDPQVHDRAGSLALGLGEQPWLARRYRAVLRERPGDAVATARLERVGRFAQAAFLATATPPPAGAGLRRGSTYVVLAVLALLVIGGMLWVMYLARNRAQVDGGGPARTPGAIRTQAPRRAPVAPAPGPPGARTPDATGTPR